ncbi:MAG: hypothetical protein AB8D78_14720 [Akkermansiaceae bacterium]
MNNSSAPSENKVWDRPSCSTGSCGGQGLCPGIALLLAYGLGVGMSLLTGIDWLGWALGIPSAIFLITGAWRFLPNKQQKP